MARPQQKVDQYDYLVKLIIIGDSGVGKTNMLLRFIDDKFQKNHFATIGVDFKIKTIQILDKRIKFQIWDTAGQERFKTICNTYYKGTSGIIIAFALDDRKTFQNVQVWIKQIKEQASLQVCKLLVGTKCDLDRKIDRSEAEKFAEQNDMQYIEVSAKDNINIQETFQIIGTQIKENILDKNDNSLNPGTQLGVQTPMDPNRGCTC